MHNGTTFLIQHSFFQTCHISEKFLSGFAGWPFHNHVASWALTSSVFTHVRIQRAVWFINGFWEFFDSPPARPASHVTVCSGPRSTFSLQVCSKTGGSWVLYCKSSRCSNKTSRPELILPPQQSVVSCAADSLTSIYSTYLSQLGFIIGVYVQGLLVFA